MPHESQILLDHRSGYKTLRDWLNRVTKVVEATPVALSAPGDNVLVLSQAMVSGHVSLSGATAYGDAIDGDNYLYHCYAGARVAQRIGLHDTTRWISKSGEVLNRAEVTDATGAPLAGGVYALLQAGRKTLDGSVIGGTPGNAQLSFCTGTTPVPVMVAQAIRVQLPLIYNGRTHIPTTGTATAAPTTNTPGAPVATWGDLPGVGSFVPEVRQVGDLTGSGRTGTGAGLWDGSAWQPLGGAVAGGPTRHLVIQLTQTVMDGEFDISTGDAHYTLTGDLDGSLGADAAAFAAEENIEILNEVGGSVKPDIVWLSSTRFRYPGRLDPIDRLQVKMP